MTASGDMHRLSELHVTGRQDKSRPRRILRGLLTREVPKEAGDGVEYKVRPCRARCRLGVRGDLNVIDFFDCDAGFGRAMVPAMRYAATAGELLEEMDFCGIAEALVYHVAIRDDAPAVGNELVLKGISGQPRLHAMWALAPPQTGEFPAPDQFAAQMKEHDIKALRAYPDQHRYLLNGVTFGPIFEIMIAANIPLMLAGDWRLITELLGEFPRLTVIALQQTNHGQDRYFRPLLEKYPNLFISTTCYECDGAIPELCQEYGSQRLLFGTGYPEVPMGGAVLTLLHCGLPQQDIEAIAASNLKRLLGGVKP